MIESLKHVGLEPFYRLGRSGERWLSMQDTYNLWKARWEVDLSDVQQLRTEAA